ncbi:9180_t:CDS:2, partial [Rhizophagus irregularis]
MEKNIQDVELEALLEYDSVEEFSDTDRLSNRDSLNANFMKKYAATKGHKVRIGGEERIDKTTQEITKRIYLCCHAGKAKSKLSKRQTKLNIYG